MATSEQSEMLSQGMWVYKIPNIPRSTAPPALLSGWQRLFMWVSEDELTIYYGEEENRPMFDIPIASCQSVGRFNPDELVAKLKGGGNAHYNDNDAPPAPFTNFAWILKTVDYSTIFVSESDFQCQNWVNGITAMIPAALRRHQLTTATLRQHTQQQQQQQMMKNGRSRQSSITVSDGGAKGGRNTAQQSAAETPSMVSSGLLPNGNEEDMFTVDAATLFKQHQHQQEHQRAHANAMMANGGGGGAAYPSSSAYYPPPPTTVVAGGRPAGGIGGVDNYDTLHFDPISAAASVIGTAPNYAHLHKQQQQQQNYHNFSSTAPPEEQEKQQQRKEGSQYTTATTLFSHGGAGSGGQYGGDCASYYGTDVAKTSSHQREPSYQRGDYDNDYDNSNNHNNHQPEPIVYEPTSPSQSAAGAPMESNRNHSRIPTTGSNTYNNTQSTVAAAGAANTYYQTLDSPAASYSAPPPAAAVALPPATASIAPSRSAAAYQSAVEQQQYQQRRPSQQSGYSNNYAVNASNGQLVPVGTSPNLGASTLYAERGNHYQIVPYDPVGALAATNNSSSQNNNNNNDNNSSSREAQEAARHKALQQEKLIGEAMDLVSMGTWLYKVQGDDALKERNSAFGNVKWNKRWVWLEGSGSSGRFMGGNVAGREGRGGHFVWYGEKKGSKEHSIDLSQCVAVDRMSRTDMIGYLASEDVQDFGLRLKYANGKNWLFACNNELETLGWYNIFKKLMPMTTMELVQSIQMTHFEEDSSAAYFEAKHKEAEAKRKQEAAEKKRAEEAAQRQLQAMALTIAVNRNANEHAMAVAEQQQRDATKAAYLQEKERLQQEGALTVTAAKTNAEQQLFLQVQEQYKKFLEQQEKEAAIQRKHEQNMAKKLAEQREAEQLEAQQKREAEVQRRVMEIRMKELEAEEAERKRKEEEAAKAEAAEKKRAEERRLLDEDLAAEDARMAEVHQAYMKSRQKESTGCCVIS